MWLTSGFELYAVERVLMKALFFILSIIACAVVAGCLSLNHRDEQDLQPEYALRHYELGDPDAPHARHIVKIRAGMNHRSNIAAIAGIVAVVFLIVGVVAGRPRSVTPSTDSAP